MQEIERKIAAVREKLGNGAVRFRGVDWFAWATAGGDGSVIFGSETAIAEVVITATRAMVLTNAIEADRLRVEEVPAAYEIVTFPWQSYAVEANAFVGALGGPMYSDRPEAGEQLLDKSWTALRLVMQPDEVTRYRALGADAAAAVREALSAAQPDMTERDLAGLAALSLWQRGIHPMLTLVAGEERLPRFRHPLARDNPLGTRAMLVVCGRRHGLYANLTRHVFFREPLRDEREREEKVALVEAAAFRATEECRTLPEIYARIEAAYGEIGMPGEIFRHHQGGPTGYLSREAVAAPGLDFPLVMPGQVFAWNPSLPGAKIEDTVFLDGKCEPITVDPDWPTFEIEGRARPAYWVRS